MKPKPWNDLPSLGHSGFKPIFLALAISLPIMCWAMFMSCSDNGNGPKRFNTPCGCEECFVVPKGLRKKTDAPADTFACDEWWKKGHQKKDTL